MTVLVLHRNDDVGVAVDGLERGVEIVPSDGHPLQVLDAIPAGHKVALRDIAKDAEVHKYGSPIGIASREISAGNTFMFTI